MERIVLAREYRVAEWLRDAYLELTRKSPSEFEELWPTEPYPNSLDGNRDWEATSREWETLARIFYLQTKVAASIVKSRDSFCFASNGCYECGETNSDACLCKCRVLAMVDEAFRGELKSLKENPEHIEHPLPCKLPISYLCPLNSIWYSQQHQQRR
jgi:hypothetical protein